MKMPIVSIYTNDKNLWLLAGFQYLFKKYWSSNRGVRVVGYTAPKKGTLQDGFSFYSIDRRNYPASEWSSGVIRSIDHFMENGEEFFIMLLEDYWLREHVDLKMIYRLCEFLYDQPRNILRIDLTADRCSRKSKFVSDFAKLENCEVIRTSANSPYQMSFQAAIWNLKLLREVLRPYESPWQSEIEGSKRLAKAGNEYIVLGTRNHPVCYQPVYRSQRRFTDISKLDKEDQEMIIKRGWV